MAATLLLRAGVSLLVLLPVLLPLSGEYGAGMVAHAAGSAEREPPGDGYEYVTCGSTIKMAHIASSMRLHSHEVSYGTGSRQQSVTLVPQVDDPNSLWTVVGDFKSGCKPGSKIKAGKVIRLQHAATKRFLHSHEHKSPLSNNQEVSAYGSWDDSNDGDLWKVEPEGQFWEREVPVRLKHVVTDKYLHSTGRHQFGRPIAGQREVCAAAGANNLNSWAALEGYFLKANIKPAKQQ